MDWKAKWIWQSTEASPRNFRLCARKEFDLRAGFNRAQIHITADSRYSLWVNGRYIGQGPVRAFTNHWRYDTYDITPYVHDGLNAVAVLVEHYGLSTFQYLEARGGLLAQIECDGELLAATGPDWKSLAHPSFSRHTPRISCQLGWVEHFDARVEPVGWTCPGFDDSAWESPVAVGEAGCQPWPELLPRDIPFLTAQPTYAQRLMTCRLVRPPKTIWSMDLKPNLIPNDLTANMGELRGVLASVIRCPEPARISVVAFYNDFKSIRVDGEEIPWDSAKAGIELSQGEHLLLVDLSGRAYHEWSATLVTEQIKGKVEFVSPLGKDASYPFVTVGPFAAGDDAGLGAISKSKSAGEIAAHPLVKSVGLEHVWPVHVGALTSLAQRLEQGARVSEPHAMLLASEDVTTISRSDEGDTELLIDFGKIIVGHVQMELSAPEGVIIDFNGFESNAGGDIQWPGGASMNNVFRYVTRSGWQTWRSTIRRGFR